MGSVLDSVILGGTLAASLAAAFLAQKVALDLFMRTMNRR
jgi:hypothetical protein